MTEVAQVPGDQFYIFYLIGRYQTCDLKFSITFEVTSLGVQEEWRDHFSSLNPATITMSCT